MAGNMYQQYQEVKRDIKNLLKESFPFTLYPSIPSEGREGEKKKAWTLSNPTDIFPCKRPLISNCDIDHKWCGAHPGVCFVCVAVATLKARSFLVFFPPPLLCNVHIRALGGFG